MKIFRISEITERAKQLLDGQFEIIDSEMFGNYELYLFKAQGNYHIQSLADYGVPIYQIGFQRKDTDFTDIDQQLKRNPPTVQAPLGRGTKWIRDVIRKWTSQFGELMAMSHSSTKTTQYKKFFDRMNINYKIVDTGGLDILVITGVQ